MAAQSEIQQNWALDSAISAAERLLDTAAAEEKRAAERAEEAKSKLRAVEAAQIAAAVMKSHGRRDRKRYPNVNGLEYAKKKAPKIGFEKQHGGEKWDVTLRSYKYMQRMGSGETVVYEVLSERPKQLEPRSYTTGANDRRPIPAIKQMPLFRLEYLAEYEGKPQDAPWVKLYYDYERYREGSINQTSEALGSIGVIAREMPLQHPKNT